MKASEQTIQQIERLIKKIAQKFPEEEDPTRLTDIHLRVYQDSGEILAYDDDDEEITRCVINDWIENKDADFYEHATNIDDTIIITGDLMDGLDKDLDSFFEKLMKE